ncbi:response regulator [Gorillibacterium massiliense]|uniref:response regulator n=1 Tax=Gorillibacterium massiliense TaxID=1280390 RepID=UPI0004B894D3|nr:response regulator [Gorillibacterium massiliense]
MANLLIVDNEKVIVDGLVGYFIDLKIEGLEVYGAYSGKEAIELLERGKFDVVLSDIKMPGMSGLELQDEVVRRWPRCKLVFLSGYDQFEFVQKAIRNGASNYILKTEGYEVIAEAVNNALKVQRETADFEKLFAESRQQLMASLPLMRKEFMQGILLGDPSSDQHLSKQITQLQFSLSDKEKSLLVIGRIDNWRGISTPSDRALLTYSIQNIADEYLTPFLQHYSFVYEASRIVWIIQPKPMPSELEHTEIQKRCLLFVQHSIQDIQSTCRDLLNMKMSFAIGSSFLGWNHLQEQFEALKLLLNMGLGTSEEAILLHNPDRRDSEENKTENIAQSISYMIQKLQNYLEVGDKTDFFELLTNALLLPAKNSEFELKLEIVLSLGGVFLSAINKWQLHQEVGKQINLDLLYRVDTGREWKEYVDFFNHLAEALFLLRMSKRVDQENDIVEKIQTYVTNHLDDDLSMTKLGAVFGHHPYYLSRMYKQITKEGLLEYITDVRMDKAKQLLRETDLKIQEVSKAVGFVSEGYFYRFFKKSVGLTPSEYRDLPKLQIRQ